MIRQEITRYEITASRPGQPTWLVGYSPRLSRAGLVGAMRRVGDAILDRLAVGDTDEITLVTRPRPHALLSGWVIGFSGRTQRDARQASEYPFIDAERA